MMMARAFGHLREGIASYPEKRSVKPLFSRLFGRPFSGTTSRRLLVLFEGNRISYSSAFPFASFAEDFAEVHDAEVRLFPTQDALTQGLPSHLLDATHVVAQSWLTDPQSTHQSLADLLSGLPIGTRTTCPAPSDWAIFS